MKPQRNLRDHISIPLRNHFRRLLHILAMKKSVGISRPLIGLLKIKTTASLFCILIIIRANPLFRASI